MTKCFLPPPSWGYSLLELHGKDALDFLQRITTADIGNLSELVAQPAYILSPQGKVLATFSLFSSVDRFYFEIEAGADAHWKNKLIETIEFYHFGELFELKDLSQNYHPTLILGETPTSLKETATWIVKHPKETLDYSTVWTKTDLPHNLNDLSELEWEYQRITHLVPRPGFEITEQVNPLELGDGVEVFSPKGCFPGQEVIEKIISIGSPPRKLCLLQSDLNGSQSMNLRLQDEVKTELGEISGYITSFIQQGKKIFALALIKKNSAQQGKTLVSSNHQFVIEKIRGHS